MLKQISGQQPKEKMLCSTCKSDTGSEGASFLCPNCLSSQIARCIKCKRLSAKYKCEKCNFTGP